MMRSLATRLLAVVLVGLLGTATAACSSGSDDDAAEPASVTEPDADDDGSDTPRLRPPDDVAEVSLPEGVEISDVTCSMGSVVLDPDSASDVDCGESHDTEGFTLEGSEDLDDCYRGLAETTDLVIVFDSDGELDIDDDRVNGHSFAGGGGEYTCQISFAEPRTDTLIRR